MVLRQVWTELNPRDKSTLINAFTADGISEFTISFIFLPLYYANALANPHVGLLRALVLHAELLRGLHAEGCTNWSAGKAINVDIMDVANATSRVETSFDFERIIERTKVSQRHGNDWVVKTGNPNELDISQQ